MKPKTPVTATAIMGTATDPTAYDRAIHAICEGSPGRFVAGQDAWWDWAQAITGSAQGDYRAGWITLAQLRGHSDPILVGMAAAAQGSILRQLGHHTQAIPHDAAATAAGGLAAVDGLTGLAADHIFAPRVGDADWLLQARGLLQRSGAAGLGSDEARQRAALRVNWVTAETQLAHDNGPGALRTASAGVSLARTLDSPRHLLKSQLIHAVSCEAVGQDAGRELSIILQAADARGIRTLVWPVGLVLGGRMDSAERAQVQTAVDFIGSHLPPGLVAPPSLHLA
ncbi:MAG: hypothetical protein K0U64_01630 [Actinomycetia bacterium]|nr:hypothetical protein [Actinomycetes bacterium]